MTFKKVYYYYYYKIYNFSKAISDDILNDVKPVAIISLSEIFLVGEIPIIYSNITKKDAVSFWPYILFITILICLFNSYFFLFRDKWQKIYFKEFKHYDKKKNIIGGWVVFLTIMLALGSLVFSIYEMSLIDWAKYR
ncbi:MAG: hypothetical protein JSS98_03395 [Bacteroidetes bacterium]|nr:hypothetical protein [Bacteroidota bacterium]